MKTIFAIGLTLTMTCSAIAQDLHVTEDDFAEPKEEYSPYVDDHYPNRVYFGDTHLHTSWSTDAGMAGATVGPDEAYRVSRGETITAFSGWKVKLIRPMDFIVVSDHAENLTGIEIEVSSIQRDDPTVVLDQASRRQNRFAVIAHAEIFLSH